MKIIKKIFQAIFYIISFLVVVLALSYFMTSGDWQVAETIAQDSTISHITIDDVVFHSEAHGSDTTRTTIVIHGGPGQDYRYLLPMKELADEFKIIFYDQRGTGLSPRVDPSELTLQSTIDDLHRIIEYYNPNEKVNILGHSWGAMVGSGYLAQHPDKVHKIILAEPGFLTSEMSEEFMQRTNGFKIDLSLSNFILLGKIVMQGLHVRGPDDQAIKDFIYGNLVSADVEDHPMNGYFCGGKYDSTQIVFWRLSMEAAQSIPQSQNDENGNMIIDLVTGTQQYQDTVLFITGDCNRLIGPDYQKLQIKYFERHKMAIIKDAGHNMFLDQPDEFYRIVRGHFKEEL